MTRLNNGFYLALVLVLIFVVSACERKITVTEEVSTAENCFACHDDNNTFLIAAEHQWSNSKHASGDNIDRVTQPCAQCHTSEGFMAAINGEPPATITNPTVIHCFTCHAPHTNSDFSLRVEDPQPLENGVMFDVGAANLCVSCHHARRNVDTYVALDSLRLSRFFGPHHSPQGDMLFGSNGYEYTGYSYEISVAHRSATQDGCLDCHFRTTENNVLGGHSFNMTFTDFGEEGESEVANTQGCNVVACHNGAVGDFDYVNTQTDVTALADSLKTLLMTAGLIDAGDHAINGRWVRSRSMPGDSAGAVWNYLLVVEGRSKGIHNPKYIKGLLESSIQFMEGTLLPSPSQPAVRKPDEPQVQEEPLAKR